MAMQEDIQEDWGWKLVHGEVFRTPRNPMALSIMVGNGAQLCAMVGVTLGESARSCSNFSLVNMVSQYSLCWVFSPRQIVVHLALS